MGNTNETENTRHSIQVAIYLTIWDYGETALRAYLWLQVNWSEHLFICMHNPREGQTRIDALKPRPDVFFYLSYTSARTNFI